jgi:tetratricopeptide (TPR) repeat protein
MNKSTNELIERAYSLKDQGNAQGALDVSRSAAARWPSCDLLHLLIGQCHDDLDQSAEAERAYRRALAIERRPQTLSFLARALRRQDRDAESLVCLREVLEIDPEFEEAHYNIGCHLRLAGDLDAALECFQRAIAIDPDYAVAHAELGFILMRRNDDRAYRQTAADMQQLALYHLRRAVELDPEYHWSRLYLANLLWQLKRVRQARVHFEAAARLRPDDGFVLSACADFLSVQSGGSDRVEPRFRKAVERAPEEPAVRYQYGQHLLRTKRYGEARRELLLADRLGHPRAREVLASIGENPAVARPMKLTNEDVKYRRRAARGT